MEASILLLMNLEEPIMNAHVCGDIPKFKKAAAVTILIFVTL